MSYWKPYTKNLAQIKATVTGKRAPLRDANRLGAYWTITIGETAVTVFKSESHFAYDGAHDLLTTPNRAMWEQIIGDCRPRWVITTGTGGAIGPGLEVGDVIVSRFVAFDPMGADPALQPFSCDVASAGTDFAQATELFSANARCLPPASSRPPQIMTADGQPTGIVTTPTYQYDDTADTAHLQGFGRLCEMGDAVLGSVCAALGAAAPHYVCVRNVSDPQVDASDPAASALAYHIYTLWGDWSSVCSAITCWAIVAAGLPS